MVDIGNMNVIPANIEKSFDQIDKALSYIHERAVFPVVLGGDHSIGYPDIRGLAPHDKLYRKLSIFSSSSYYEQRKLFRAGYVGVS
jgi:arginase family enzyme